MRKVELRYGELALQRVDVFCREEEEEETSFHLLVFVHGGLWTNGDKSQHVQLAHLLCRPNWRVAVCNYRLSDPKSENPVMAPEHTNDVARCLCFLHASLRPKRVVLVGQSCGAHMAALICSGVCEPRVAELPELVVAVQGMFSNRQFVREYPEWKPEVDRSQGSDESKWIDPIAEHCTKSEWLLIHSPSDPWVKAEQSRVFASAILAAGGRAVLDEEERGKHFASVRDDEAEIKKLAEVRRKRNWERRRLNAFFPEDSTCNGGAGRLVGRTRRGATPCKRGISRRKRIGS
jgi:acetyl esterase/lipase